MRETAAPEPIRASTVLPARRSALRLETADGLALVGALALPADRDPVATLVCLHPLPEAGGGGTPGGSMDSHVLRKAAWRLPALAGVAVLRLNTRGTVSAEGRSEGSFDEGVGERWDLAAALDVVEALQLPAPWLLGWSFGSEVVLRWGAEDPTPVGGILLSPPLRALGLAGLPGWAADGRPLLAVVPELDDYARPPAVRVALAAVPQAQVVEVAGSRHLLVGHVEAALDAAAAAMVPGAAPLARDWPG